MDRNVCKWAPVPYFQINQEGTILNSSNISHSYFHPTSNIWNIVHKEDLTKAILMLSRNASSTSITERLRLQTRNTLFVNFKCTIQWKDGIGHLVCTEDKSIKVQTVPPLSVLNSLVNTQKRLEKTEKQLNKIAQIISIKKH
ncbi:hypothetical protein IUJ58_25865 (plasmid) [Priestia aryabhattai]|uniref:hypothetical protein n=1 Tax=Priestia aryabhattai TaxID=412384 RepID=UPI002378BFB9|nr:hypothetical protein [Priestia aryabhattai]WDL89784.1 hypothetical protein IUJ58_25865 [Priestia aryabhattai]